jgi:hypothetical protein
MTLSYRHVSNSHMCDQKMEPSALHDAESDSTSPNVQQPQGTWPEIDTACYELLGYSRTLEGTFKTYLLWNGSAEPGGDLPRIVLEIIEKLHQRQVIPSCLTRAGRAKDGVEEEDDEEVEDVVLAADFEVDVAESGKAFDAHGKCAEDHRHDGHDDCERQSGHHRLEQLCTTPYLGRHSMPYLGSNPEPRLQLITQVIFIIFANRAFIHYFSLHSRIGEKKFNHI